MLVDVAHLDAAALGVKAAAAGSSSSGSNNIIVDEFDALWTYLTAKAQHAAARTAESSMTSPLSRVDIILDNAGLELYTDLVLADYLVESGLAGVVGGWAWQEVQGEIDAQVWLCKNCEGLHIWKMGINICTVTGARC